MLQRERMRPMLGLSTPSPEHGVVMLLTQKVSHRAMALCSAMALSLLPHQSAWAEDVGAADIESLKLVAGFIDSILGKNTIDMFVTSAIGIAGNLNEMAMGLAATFALIATLWAILMAMVSRQSVLTALVEPLIFATLTALLLANYSMIVNDVVSLGQHALAATGKTVGSAFTGFLDAFLKVFLDLFINTLKRFNSGWSFITIIFEAIVAFLILAAAGVLVLIALKDVIAVFLTGPVALGIGVAVGPLLIATLPWPATKRWFDQWINFMINAAMLTALAVIVMVLIQGAIIQSVAGFAKGEDGTVGKALAIALVAASLSKIFQAIPTFADALFPGRTGAGAAMVDIGKGVGNMAKDAVKLASAMASGGASAVAGMAKAASGMAGAGMRTGAALGGKGGAAAARSAAGAAAGSTGSTGSSGGPTNGVNIGFSGIGSKVDN